LDPDVTVAVKGSTLTVTGQLYWQIPQMGVRRLESLAQRDRSVERSRPRRGSRR
jgi:hypothetical protein